MEECVKPVAKQWVRCSGRVYFCLPVPWVQTASYSWSESYIPIEEVHPPALSHSHSGSGWYCGSKVRRGRRNRGMIGRETESGLLAQLRWWKITPARADNESAPRKIPAAGALLSELADEIHSAANRKWAQLRMRTRSDGYADGGRRAELIQTRWERVKGKYECKTYWSLQYRSKVWGQLKCIRLFSKDALKVL